MSVSKLEWNPRQSIEGSAQVADSWLKRALELNVIAREAPTLYHAYILDEAPSMALFKGLSGLFRFSSKDDPELHRARDKALRLLSVALKAQFFLGQGTEARHEPYLFSFLDLSHPGRPHYGLAHRIDPTGPAGGASSKSRTIVVATTDLALMSSELSQAPRFPVVLPEDPQAWIDLPRWALLAQQGDAFERLMRPLRAKKQEEQAVASHRDADNFPYGTLLDVPYSIKDEMKATGIHWATGIRRWYAPLGHDAWAIGQYVQWAKSLQERAPEQFEAIFWRETAQKKKAEKPATPRPDKPTTGFEPSPSATSNGARFKRERTAFNTPASDSSSK